MRVLELAGRAPVGLVALLLLALGPVVGCGAKIQGPPPSPPIEGYVVGAPDELRIHVLPEPEIVREVRVRPDGMISVDLVGDIQAAGRTPSQIAATIQREISKYKRDASVNVSVVTSPSRFVTVYGEVGTPATFPLERELRVSEAIGQVGGTRPFASLNNVRVVRQDGTDAKVLEVRLKDIQNGDLSTNLVLREGDLVVVPPTVLARIGYTLQMIFFPFQPVLFTTGSVGATLTGFGRVGAF